MATIPTKFQAGLEAFSTAGVSTFSVSDAGAVVMGAPSGTQIQRVYGQLKSVFGSTGDGWCVNGRETGSITRQYAYGVDASTNGIHEFYTIRQDGTNGIVAIKYDGTGAVTLGPASGLTATHVIQNSSVTAAAICKFVKRSTNTSVNNTEYVYFEGANGSLDGYIANNGSAVLTLVDSSDERKKENIRSASYGLSTIKALRPVEFDWKSGVKNVKGFIAQEVKEVLPESVSIIDESEKGGFVDAHYLETQTMIPVLVKAIQELSAQVISLQAESASLRDELAALKAK
jgi:hypothetical protein